MDKKMTLKNWYKGRETSIEINYWNRKTFPHQHLFIHRLPKQKKRWRVQVWQGKTNPVDKIFNSKLTSQKFAKKKYMKKH